MILDHFVLDDAHARLGHRHLGERYTLLVGGGRRGEKDLIDLFLRVRRELRLRFF